MGLHAGCITCDVCGGNLSIPALVADETVEYYPFDMSLDGGQTCQTLHCCIPCFDAGYVQAMSEQNSPAPLPEGPLRTALEKAIASQEPPHA